jgi:hypothetical protein
MTSYFRRPFTEFETSRSPQRAPETSRLPRAAQLPAVTRLPLLEEATTVPRSGWSEPDEFWSEPDEWKSTPLVRPTSEPSLNWTKYLIAIAVAALPAGYFIFRNSDRPADVAAAPQATTDVPHVEFMTSQESQAPAAAAAGTNVESKVEPGVQAPSLQQRAPLDTKPTETGIKAKPPPMLAEKESFAAGRDAYTCFPSASAVRESRPGAWPSWTLRAPGHEGTRCWYAATRASHDHR